MLRFENFGVRRLLDLPRRGPIWNGPTDGGGTGVTNIACVDPKWDTRLRPDVDELDPLALRGEINDISSACADAKVADVRCHYQIFYEREYVGVIPPNPLQKIMKGVLQYRKSPKRE